ncbi:hypothetical protein TURU_086472 [Turdus rufiventris]|nr:hypothetical protein TURU_086472 [Turdus rufiventris]
MDRGQQGLAAVTARGLLEKRRAAVLRLLRAQHSSEEQDEDEDEDEDGEEGTWGLVCPCQSSTCSCMSGESNIYVNYFGDFQAVVHGTLLI